ncbi:MAG: isocitrate/isopropylmalate dehydrogenase family protein [Pyrinomonadaceae bacterium]|nr:isocitrate/isopropylmalate dehydrogenase family protein [Pyrinomonadaceae bacterium]
MKRLTIAVIAGDGVGPEVIFQGKRVLERIGRKHEVTFIFKDFPWGADYYFHHGVMMPPEALDLLRPCDAIFLGAVGHPGIPDHTTLNGLLLPIRRTFDQYACVRPAILYPGVSSPLAKSKGDIDLVIVRENTEGEYAQVGGFVYQHQSEEVAIQTAVFTRRGIERIVRYAFELAVKRNKKRRVTSVTKSNAQGFGMVLWDRTFQSVAAEYPNIETESLLVDAAAMDFIRRPESFDVVVASNLFGDILSDISAILVGSMGLAPSANLDPLHRYPSMFEPVHGSAPDIVGKNIVNPLATILSAAMMLEHLELPDAARDIEEAVASVLAEGLVCTPDLNGANTTSEVTDAVLAKLDH